MEVIFNNGVRLGYERQGSGTPLLLIHGFPLDHTVWQPLVHYLGGNFDMLMPDLRGFGQSDLPEGEYGLTDMATDLVGLLDQLHITKTYLAGHSMGGYVALAFANIYPDRVLGLSLIGSQALPDSSERQLARQVTAQQVAVNGSSAVVGMSENLSADPRFFSFFREIILRQSPPGLIGALKAMAIRPDATSFLSKFEFPIELVHGLADALIPIDRAHEIKLIIPQATLIELPGVGHSPMLEAPEQTALALIQLSAQTTGKWNPFT